MSRSVSVPSEVTQVVYTTLEQDNDDEDNWIWDDFIASLKAEAQAKIAGMEECDVWVDREDHAILQNSHALLGVSEYCGLVSVWIRPNKNFVPQSDADELAQALECNNIPLAKIVEAANGTVLRHVATFSNGEAVYERSQP